MIDISKFIKSKTVKIIIVVVLVAAVVYGGLQLAQSRGWLKEKEADIITVVEEVPVEPTD